MIHIYKNFIINYIQNKLSPSMIMEYAKTNHFPISTSESIIIYNFIKRNYNFLLNGEEDKLKGYEYGADDYMTKPFSPKVLLAKVNALLRRFSPGCQDALNAGKITIVPSAHKVFLDGQEIALTHKEYGLLYFFMTNPEQVFTREQLLNKIWGYDFEGTTRTVDTHIKTLRQKLGSEGRHIATLIRSGYKFEAVV